MLQKLINWLRSKPVYVPEHQFTESRIKLMFNPFVEKVVWVRLNPANHTWEWKHEATELEIQLWNGQTEFVKQYGIDETEIPDWWLGHKIQVLEGEPKEMSE